MPQSREDWDDVTACVACGLELVPETDRAFACGPDAYLCFECSEQRGGVFDSDGDRWTVAPDVSDLFDERRPHP